MQQQKVNLKGVRALDLALQAGKLRQSSNTGFVHVLDTIPLYENFCFVFALFRTRIGESILEGKELLSRLLHFQEKSGNFPVFLHEYPQCKDQYQAFKIAPMLIHILREYGSVLQADYKQRIQETLNLIMQMPAQATWEHRYKAMRGEKIEFPNRMLSSHEWVEWLISDQLLHQNQRYPIPYHQRLQLFLGDSLIQEGKAPQSVTLEYILAEEQGYTNRLLQDHLHQLHSAALLPFQSSLVKMEPFVRLEGAKPRFFWGDQQIYSLIAPNGILKENEILFHLSGEPESRKDDLFEATFFCSPGKVKINGEKGTVFYLNDTITIETGDGTITELQFRLVQGEGRFCGHLSFGNRPHQTACTGDQKFAAFDLQISLRTLFREKICQIAVSINQYSC